jgi:uncharacterized metal-binding protein
MLPDTYLIFMCGGGEIKNCGECGRDIAIQQHSAGLDGLYVCKACGSARQVAFEFTSLGMKLLHIYLPREEEGTLVTSDVDI